VIQDVNVEQVKVKTIIQELQAAANSKKAVESARFFKTAKGEYGYGDVFLGISVPIQRQIARQYKDTPLIEVEKLLQSKYHEARLTALFILVLQYKRKQPDNKSDVVALYLRNTAKVNNWDLVDSSAPYILGEWLADKDRKILYQLANSDSLWEKRISMIACYGLIKQGDFADTLKLAKQFLQEKHDLMHKAVGWMLREVGNRNRIVEENFLQQYYATMPRTMLRYAIEKFPESLRQDYLKGRI